jgi:hypothetical protein
LLAVGVEDDFDVRSMVPGTCEPWTVYAKLKADTRFAHALGTSLGGIIAEQHRRVNAKDADWLPSVPSWPRPRDWVCEQVAAVVESVATRGRVDIVMRAYEDVDVEHRVLVHSDLAPHNFTVDLARGMVLGVFDYASAAWADSHHDFRYLVFDFSESEVLDAALAVYEAANGSVIDRGRVYLYNAACAASYLAFRAGVPAEERHCGRTLQEDLEWFEFAYERAFSA